MDKKNINDLKQGIDRWKEYPNALGSESQAAVIVGEVAAEFGENIPENVNAALKTLSLRGTLRDMARAIERDEHDFTLSSFYGLAAASCGTSCVELFQNYHSHIENILRPLESDNAITAIKDNSFNFPGHEAFDDWNTLPFGNPSGCKEKLVTFIVDEVTLFEVLGRALAHLGKLCICKTKLAVFYVAIEKSVWDSVWKLYKPAFHALEKKQEIVLLVKFRHKQNNDPSCPVSWAEALAAITIYLDQHRAQLN